MPIPPEREAQDRPVLQRAAERGDPGAWTAPTSTTCRSTIIEQGLDAEVLDVFGMKETRRRRTSPAGRDLPQRSSHPDGEVNIAVVGKYTAAEGRLQIPDRGPDPRRRRQQRPGQARLGRGRGVREGRGADRRAADRGHGVLVPGAFGERGSEGMIRAVRFAREHGMPYFGICFGMQMAMIEAARNLAGMRQGASSTEFGPTSRPVVGLMTEWVQRQRDGDPRRGRRPGRHHAAAAPMRRC